MVARRVLFIAACLALVTSAFSFQMRANVSDQWAFDFTLTKEIVGTVMAAAFLGMAISMLIFSPLAEFLGLGRIMILAWVCHITGILGSLFSGQLAQISAFQTIADGVAAVATPALGWFLGDLPGGETSAYWILFFSTFLVGCGNGLTEVWINPLAASLYPDQKTHKLNVLHAWWPGGLIIAGLLALYVVNPIVGFDPDAEGAVQKDVVGALNPEGGVAVNAAGEEVVPNDPEVRTLSWRVKIGLLLIPLLAYGVLCVGRRFPKTERAEAEVPIGTAFLQLVRPLFLVLAVCMLLTAATELGTNNWQESVLKRTTDNKVSGTVIFVYISAIMFVLRFFAGTIVERISPITLMMFSSVLAAIGLYWISFAETWYVAFPAATVFAVGITYFWPTMLGITAERFPKGGAMIIGLMGCFGNLSIAFVLPQIGKVYDSYTVANIPANVRTLTFNPPVDPDNPDVIPEKETIVIDPAKERGPDLGDVSQEGGVMEFFFPEGTKKLNPKLTPEIRQQQLSEETQKILQQAEKAGAQYAFRRVAILPAILVAIFGLLALIDRLRGGYRVEHITDGRH